MSDITEMVVEVATRLFSEQCTPQVAAEAEKGVFPSALWHGIEDGGLASMLAAEEHGGIAASPAVALAALRVAGRHAVPLPLPETMIARWLLSKAGIGGHAGPASFAIVGRPGGWRVDGGKPRSTLHGSERAVAWGAAARTVVAIVPEGDGVAVAVLEQGQLKVEGRSNIAGEPRDRLTADAVPLHLSRVPGATADLVWRMASLLRGGLICGALQRILELSVAHARERVQFGRPLAKFQAIQQQLAELAGAVAAGTAITNAAASAVEREDGDLMVAAMRSRLADAIDAGAAIAHQVHGAIGFARDYELHLYTRRLWAWRDEYGSAVEWRERLGRAFAGTPADELWPRLARLGAAGTP